MSGSLNPPGSCSAVPEFVEGHSGVSYSPRRLPDRIFPAEHGQVQFIPACRLPLPESEERHSLCPTSAILWRLVATSQVINDHWATRTGDGMGRGGSAPLETKVARPSVLTPSAPCVVLSRPRLMWRSHTRGSSVPAFTLPLRLPSSYHAFPSAVNVFH